MIFDSHMHTEFSEDSEMKIEDAILKSKENNFGIILTEHMDLDQPIGIGFRFNIDDYFKKYEKYRNSTTLLGIELGLSLSTVVDNGLIAKNNPFDYVLGSIHSVYEDDIYTKFGKLEMSKEDKFNKYLDCMLDCIKANNQFDSLGHIDYISRYTSYSDNELTFDTYKDKLEEIIRLVINNDKVLELNTRRLSDKNSVDNLLKIYSFYKELGGKYLTIGSDAHRSVDIFNNFDVGLEMIETLGLKGIYFKNRKPQYF